MNNSISAALVWESSEHGVYVQGDWIYECWKAIAKKIRVGGGDK